jgi:hypothetical protein
VRNFAGAVEEEAKKDAKAAQEKISQWWSRLSSTPSKQ